MDPIYLKQLHSGPPESVSNEVPRQTNLEPPVELLNDAPEAPGRAVRFPARRAQAKKTDKRTDTEATGKQTNRDTGSMQTPTD